MTKPRPSWRRRFGSDTQVLYDHGAIHRLPALVSRSGWEHVLLVCGRRSFDASGAASILPDLKKRVEVTLWQDFAPNPAASDLFQGLKILRETKPPAIIGIGGGSAMDMAKLLSAYAESDPQDLEANLCSGKRITHRAVDLVLAPTTSGSGSEATHFAVVYIGENKHSIAGPAMKPDATILDPSLTLTSSTYQRAASGLDAVAQAIESLWAVSATNRSRLFARLALFFLLPAIEPFVENPTLPTARAMTLGSHLAGRAIDISKTTAAHALSYAITKRYGISHGHAVALTLGPLIELHANAKNTDLQSDVAPDEHRKALSEILRRLGAGDGVEARQRFLDLLSRLGLPASLRQAGVSSSEERRLFAKTVNKERLSNNPIRLSPQTLESILNQSG